MATTEEVADLIKNWLPAEAYGSPESLYVAETIAEELALVHEDISKLPLLVSATRVPEEGLSSLERHLGIDNPFKLSEAQRRRQILNITDLIRYKGSLTGIVYTLYVFSVEVKLIPLYATESYTNFLTISEVTDNDGVLEDVNGDPVYTTSHFTLETLGADEEIIVDDCNLDYSAAPDMEVIPKDRVYRNFINFQLKNININPNSISIGISFTANSIDFTSVISDDGAGGFRVVRTPDGQPAELEVATGGQINYETGLISQLEYDSSIVAIVNLADNIDISYTFKSPNFPAGSVKISDLRKYLDEQKPADSVIDLINVGRIVSDNLNISSRDAENIRITAVGESATDAEIGDINASSSNLFPMLEVGAFTIGGKSVESLVVEFSSKG